MLYCDPCAKKNGYPETFSKSYGNCECCKKTAPCNIYKFSQSPKKDPASPSILVTHPVPWRFANKPKGWGDRAVIFDASNECVLHTYDDRHLYRFYVETVNAMYYKNGNE